MTKTSAEVASLFGGTGHSLGGGVLSVTPGLPTPKGRGRRSPALRGGSGSLAAPSPSPGDLREGRALHASTRREEDICVPLMLAELGVSRNCWSHPVPLAFDNSSCEPRRRNQKSSVASNMSA